MLEVAEPHLLPGIRIERDSDECKQWQVCFTILAISILYRAKAPIPSRYNTHIDTFLAILGPTELV